MSKTTWREMITETLGARKETWDDVEAHTFTGTQLDDGFDNGYGGSEGCPFTVWTKNYVYFPAVYDGCEWCACVPRNPAAAGPSEASSHVGGE